MKHHATPGKYDTVVDFVTVRSLGRIEGQGEGAYSRGMAMTEKLYETDPLEIPRYSVPDAARYVRMPQSTLTTWVAGRTYPVAEGKRAWKGLIRRPDPTDSRLSYSNLIEAYVLRSLRKVYHVNFDQLRTAVEYARNKLGLERVLLNENLRAMEGNVLLQHLGKLINLSQSGQLMSPVFESYLKRIHWKDPGVPAEFVPLTRSKDEELTSPDYLGIVPDVAFGRPIIRSKAISTSTVSDRFMAGEPPTQIAEDYGLEIIEVLEAIRYEYPRAA